MINADPENSSATILIVDDEAANRKLLEVLLRAEGYATQSAASGEEAQESVARHSPDLILLDIMMPGMDGLQVASALKANAATSNIPIIMVTAQTDPGIRLASLDTGAEDFLTKPLDRFEVSLRVRNLLRLKLLSDLVKNQNDILEQRLQARVADLHLFRSAMDATADGIVIVNRVTMRFVEVNATACAIFGYERQELMTIGPTAIFGVAHANLATTYEEIIAGTSQHRVFEADLRRKNGSSFAAEIQQHAQRCGDEWIIVGIVRDITNRKAAAAALARESHRNQVFLRNASDAVHILDADGNILELSDSFCKMLGYPRDELIGANISLWNAEGSTQDVKRSLSETIATGERSVFETRHRRRDGSSFDVEISAKSLEVDGRRVIFNSARDISDRKQADEALRVAAEQFRGLVEQSIAGIYLVQDGKFVYGNPRFAEIFRYPSPAEINDLDALSVVAATDRAMVADVIARLISGTESTTNFRFTGIRKDGVTVDIEMHGAHATHGGRPAVIGLVQDISEKARAEEEIRRYIAELKSAFMSTVEVGMTLSEMRDPYTTGHERRVAEIAVAIGAELGFDERRQEGLRVAGHLHDVGKITIPAEILSKPTRLNPIEFLLIQGHAQASYDALKNVKFPWPIAEVALQHHERMDGSGYPRGLKGEEILLESRIMSVADVVDAMSSHRPYRPSLGPEKALAEIERGRGSAYDPLVADACLKLFREKGYAISG
jgi:PAS domain S-box-containing protein